MGNFLTLPPDFFQTLKGYISDIFQDFQLIFVILIGLFIGFYIIERIFMNFGAREISEED